ncbi:alpha/beta hydrolase [Hoyosella altamirensis]|uniref:Acetyl esterase/lipase n=1 Tax=Hoyosella altamirensis TaxID=616997 RepID=A0A839RPG7_9ACTN|nr:alpha/beta hydrolase [Hoyosella altamirensis]MBB3038209.1 acetyl esterase/lipase [Hoyosella altamirensis]
MFLGVPVPAILLLTLGIIALILAVNSRWPRTRGRIMFFSWPLAWFLTELALHFSVLLVLVGAVLIWAGALGSAVGWAGAVTLLAGVALILAPGVKALTTPITVTPPLPGRFIEERHQYPRLHVLLPPLAWWRRDVEKRNNITYHRIGNLELKLDATLPKKPYPGKRPAIINVHGGGWTTGSRKEQGVPLIGHLAANGWVGFNVDYRLSPRATWPEHIVDVKRAILYIRAHAADFGIDPGFIAITGGSAGGHLSSLAALTGNDPALQPGFEDADTSVAACVPFYGVYDFVDDERVLSPGVRWIVQRMVFKRRRGEDPEPFRQASPLHRMTRDAPPFFVIHGVNDSLITVEEARRFVRKLQDVSGQPAYYTELPGGQHAFDMIPSVRTIRVLDSVHLFLDVLWREHCTQNQKPSC